MEEDIYKDAQKVNLITLLRTFKKEGLENFIVIRRNKFENLLKENEELKTMLKNRITYTNELEQDLFENASNYVVPVAKIKEKIELLEKLKQKNAKRNFDTVYKDGYFSGGIDCLSELLEGK